MDDKIKQLKKKISQLEKEIDEAKKEKDKKGKKKEKEVEAEKKEVKMVKKKKEGFVPTKTLVKWKAFSRVFVKRDKAWFLKVAIVGLLFILIAAFLQDFLVILVISVLVLIVFLLGSVPPDEVKHKITNKGIRSIGKLYKWEDMEEFWVAIKNNQRILYIKTNVRTTPKLVLLIPRRLERKIVKLVGQRLDYKDIGKKQGWLSKISDGEYVPAKKYYDLFDEKENSE